MIFDQARSKDLTDAIAAVKGTLNQQDKQRLDRVSFVIAKLGIGNNPVEYAGIKENDMFTAGSLLKVSLLYTSFELLRGSTSWLQLLPGTGILSTLRLCLPYPQFLTAKR
jgi:hypothetical protein